MPIPRQNADRTTLQPIKRLLGQVLVDGGFISDHDLERALQEQKHSNEMLGEVLIRMGVLAPGDLSAALYAQGELASCEDALRSAAGPRQLLGELLLTAKRISPEHLDLALEEHWSTGERLGEILVGRGRITRNELDVALAFQKRQAGEGPVSDRFRLGEILVATGQITREQLDKALSRQRYTPKNVGEILIEKGVVKPHQVAYGRQVQKKLLSAALIASLAFAAEGYAQETPANVPMAGEDSATVQVTARVLPRMTVLVLRQHPKLVVSGADIAKGYVDVRSASLIEIGNNEPRGCLLFFQCTEGAFREVHIQGLGREAQVGPQGGFVSLPCTKGRVTVELSYRFILDENANPGTYPWPIAIGPAHLTSGSSVSSTRAGADVLVDRRE